MNENLASASISESSEKQYRLFLECKSCGNFEMIFPEKKTREYRINCRRCKKLIVIDIPTIEATWSTGVYKLT